MEKPRIKHWREKTLTLFSIPFLLPVKRPREVWFDLLTTHFKLKRIIFEFPLLFNTCWIAGERLLSPSLLWRKESIMGIADLVFLFSLSLSLSLSFFLSFSLSSTSSSLFLSLSLSLSLSLPFWKPNYLSQLINVSLNQFLTDESLQDPHTGLAARSKLKLVEFQPKNDNLLTLQVQLEIEWLLFRTLV